jgi:hypothetical protein
MNYYGVMSQGENHAVDSRPYPLMSEQLVRLPLRIPASLKRELLELAEREHRSLNKQIEFLLDRCIREAKTSETDESQRARIARGKQK